MKKTDWADIIGKIDQSYVVEAEQWSKAAQKKTNQKHLTAMAACVCLLLIGAAVSFSMLQVKENETSSGEMLAESAAADRENQPNESASVTMDAENEQAVAPENKTESQADAAGTQDSAAEPQTDAAETQESAAASNAGAKEQEQITINQAAKIEAVTIDMACQYEVSMNEKEIEDYYGVTVFLKNLPAALTAEVTGQSTSEENGSIPAQTQMATEKGNHAFEGIIRYGEKEKVVDDNNTFFYTSEDGKKSLSISVRTTDSGIITEFVDDNLKTSSINGNEVTIAKIESEDEDYIAIFEKEGVTFTIETQNLTEEELLIVLRELC